LIKFGPKEKLKDLESCLSKKNSPDACQSSVCMLFVEHFLREKISQNNLERILLVLEMTQISDSTIWGKTLLAFSKVPSQQLKERLLHLLIHKPDFAFLFNESSYKVLNMQVLMSLALEFNQVQMVLKLLIFPPEILLEAFPNTNSLHPTTPLFTEIAQKILELLHSSRSCVANSQQMKVLFQMFAEIKKKFKKVHPKKNEILMISLYIQICTRSKCVSCYVNCFQLLIAIAAQETEVKSSHQKKSNLINELSVPLFNLIVNSDCLTQLSEIERFNLTKQLITTGLFWRAQGQPFEFMLLLKVLVHVRKFQQENNTFYRCQIEKDCGDLLYDMIDFSQGSNCHKNKDLVVNVINFLLESKELDNINLAIRCLSHKNAPKFLSQPNQGKTSKEARNSQHSFLLRESLKASFKFWLQLIVKEPADNLLEKFTQVVEPFKKIHLDALELETSFQDENVEHFWGTILECNALYFSLGDFKTKKEDRYASRLFRQFRELFDMTQALKENQKRILKFSSELDAFALLSLLPNSENTKVQFYNKIVLNLKEHIMNESPIQDRSELHRFQQIYTRFITLVSPHDQTRLVDESLGLGEFHKQNCLEFLQVPQIWEEKKSAFTMCQAFVAGAFEQPPTPEVLAEVVKIFSQTNNPKISPHLLSLFMMHTECLTFETITPFIAAIKHNASLVVFMGGVFLLMECQKQSLVTSMPTKTAKTLHRFAKLYLESLANMKTIPKGSKQYLNLWKTMMDIYLDWNVYEKNYKPLFKLLSAATYTFSRQCLATNELTHTLLFLLMTPVSLSRLESRISKDSIDEYAKTKDAMLKEWLQLLDDGILEKDHEFILGMFNYFVAFEHNLTETKGMLENLAQYASNDWYKVEECESHLAALEAVHQKSDKVFSNTYLSELKKYNILIHVNPVTSEKK